jgi:hypothetical protein
MKKTINKTLLVLAVTTGISFASVSSYADDVVSAKTETTVKRNSDGSFSKNTTAVDKDSKGTTTSSSNTVNSKLDADGDYKKSIENKTVVDPKGLMNKKTTKTSEKMEKHKGDTKYHYNKKVNGKTMKEETLEYNKK